MIRYLLKSGLAILVLTFVFINYSGTSLATVPGNNTIVSNNGAGNQANGDVGDAKISKFGERVVFVSTASNLVSGDTNGLADVFVRDISSSTVRRISVSTNGVEADRSSNITAISSTGRFIAFQSQATNLLDGQTLSDYYTRTYLHDLETGETEFIDNNGNPTYMKVMGISEEGRFLLIESAGGSNILPGEVSGSAFHVFMFDRSNNSWRLVNKTYTGDPQNGPRPSRDSDQSAMSCDSSFVVFRSKQTNLTPNDTNGRADVFLADLRNGVDIINITESANGHSFEPDISCDGRYVTFTSYATNLVSGLPTNTYEYIYRYDRLTGQIDAVPPLTATAPFGQNIFMGPSTVSDYGDVLYYTNALNVIPGYSGNFDVYIGRVDAGITETLSVDSTGIISHGNTLVSYHDALTSDGKTAIFKAHDGNLIPGDNNGKADVFMAETGL